MRGADGDGGCAMGGGIADEIGKGAKIPQSAIASAAQ